MATNENGTSSTRPLTTGPLPKTIHPNLKRLENFGLFGCGEDVGVQGLSQRHEDPLLADGVAAHADQRLRVQSLLKFQRSDESSSMK